VPGFHYYRVFIDGVQVNDPSKSPCAIQLH
jgi:hypothetical protein